MGHALAAAAESPEPTTTHPPLKVLVVDDDPMTRKLIARLVTRRGHEALTADDGLQAVEQYVRHKPDIVVMDVSMPFLDGYEACRRIKRAAGDRFVPVIFVTATSDVNDLVRCIHEGGDYFLAKPVNPVIFDAKVESLERIRRVHETVRLQNDEIERRRDEEHREQEIAHGLFQRILAQRHTSASNIRSVIAPAALFHGDLVLWCWRPDGGQNVLVGDFTGHGLRAAIGALPVADLFYDRSAEGWSIRDMAREINRKLRTILPPGMFLAACLLEVDSKHGRCLAWNGGVPEALVVRPGAGVVARVRSSHLPLGIVDESRFDDSVQVLEVDPGDRIFSFTDGIPETANESGIMFGAERIAAILESAAVPERAFDDLIFALHDFSRGSAQSDDVTLVEVRIDPSQHWPPRPVLALPARGANAPCRLALDLGPDALRRVDAGAQFEPLLELAGLPAERAAAVRFTFAELFSNALEHGLLGLDSGLKAQPEGFERYYEQRAEALRALAHGRIRVEVEATAGGAVGSGRLVVRVTDSGCGFDAGAALAAPGPSVTPSGRGLRLVRALSDELQFSRGGRRAEATFRW